jgi:hypothetical protein
LLDRWKAQLDPEEVEKESKEAWKGKREMAKPVSQLLPRN